METFVFQLNDKSDVNILENDKEATKGVSALVKANLQQQEAGEMTDVGGFFALERQGGYITTALSGF